jgi:hypothetical protein
MGLALHSPKSGGVPARRLPSDTHVPAGGASPHQVDAWVIPDGLGFSLWANLPRQVSTPRAYHH